MSGDDHDRPKLSWREIDQRRSQGSSGRGDARPRGKAAEAREAEASRGYLKDADRLFASPEAEELAKAMRDAHGSPEFVEACRAYRARLGTPRDPALLSLFLDSADADLVSTALEALLALAQGDGFEASAGLRSQLRSLAESPDDNIAGAAEDLVDGVLERLAEDGDVLDVLKGHC